MVYGPQYSHINRITPVDGDHAHDQGEGRKKKMWKGRSWTEEEEDLPFHPTIPAEAPPEKASRPPSSGVYANRVLLEKAQSMFNCITTLEEKVAQLCFLETEAVYDAAIQQDIGLLIQAWQIGGVIFKTGEYKRQLYLIDYYQEVSKTPLLIANDFLHGLSFYLQGDVLQGVLTEQRCSDIGKAVMFQNRRLGVQIQLDRERGAEELVLNEKQAKAFRKGVREAHGIVGKEKIRSKPLHYSHTVKSVLPYLSLAEAPIVLSELQVQETISFKGLIYFDMSGSEVSEESLLAAYKDHYDIFLFTDQISEGVRALCKLVHSGKIREEELDRRIMRVLIIKSLYF